ncbi:unnamed protein product [Clonostachys byssicola]|uniref:3-dehydroquinate dehydratase n=1 Tax=Clonostachys byssicola TaxID=160290 RepID=A0A9N9XYH6_9HYPO|nr:unnamed protein product [Clonostachys byssicola]
MAASSGSDILSANYQNGKQTFIIPLTFQDVNDAKHVLTRIGYSGDIWELRVDLLGSGVIEEENIPDPQYVKKQLETLQSLSPLPILFTIRTRSQGGKFPDTAVQEALDLMILAVDAGVGYIDVEIEWPDYLIQEITKRKSESKVVASYHSWTGDVRWTGEVLREKFVAANSFGDIIKLSILSTVIEDCFDLGLFVRDYKAQHEKPLLAVGMGLNGQLSRITSPISLVTHPLIPFPSAPSQLSLAEVHKARYLIGQLEKRDLSIRGTDERSVRRVAQCLQAAFDELGYPHFCHVDGSDRYKTITVTETLESADSVLEFVGKLFTSITERPAPLSVIEQVASTVN